jgi:hypothetical protein
MPCGKGIKSQPSKGFGKTTLMILKWNSSDNLQLILKITPVNAYL